MPVVLVLGGSRDNPDEYKKSRALIPEPVSIRLV